MISEDSPTGTFPDIDEEILSLNGPSGDPLNDPLTTVAPELSQRVWMFL
jgi:hypothetical protein